MSDTLVLNQNGQPLSLLPLSSIPWKDAIKLVYLEKLNIIEEYDDWIVNSPSISMKVPSIVMTSDYVAIRKYVKYNRSIIYLRDNYICQICGDKPNSQDLTLDHVTPKSKGGKTNWDNIITACKKCNHRKGSKINKNIMNKAYKPNYFELVAKRKKYPIWIPCEKWKMFLDWDDKLIYMRD